MFPRSQHCASTLTCNQGLGVLCSQCGITITLVLSTIYAFSCALCFLPLELPTFVHVTYSFQSIPVVGKQLMHQYHSRNWSKVFPRCCSSRSLLGPPFQFHHLDESHHHWDRMMLFGEMNDNAIIWPALFSLYNLHQFGGMNDLFIVIQKP